MTPNEFTELVNKVACLFAAERHDDRILAGRMRVELQAMLEAIGTRWAAADAAAAAAEPIPATGAGIGRLAPAGLPFARMPGRSALEIMADEVLEELVHLKREDGGGDRLGRFRRLNRALARLTGWTDAEIAGRLFRAGQDMDAEARAAKGGAS